MNKSRLTVVIPTHDRPGYLPDALDSLLGQTHRPRIVLADDGDADRTAAILRGRYGEALRDGTIRHIPRECDGAWGNWKAGAEAVETPFMAFLQDDDIVSRHYAERILFAFDECDKLGARPLVWFARLECSDATARMAIPMAGNGPIAPTRSLFGLCEPAHYREGRAVAPSMYLTAWSLSPGLAYRTGDRYRATLDAIPDRCDIFLERLMPAEMAVEGGFIADPAVVGYWRQHDSHLSRALHPDQPRQAGVFLKHMDDLLDRLGDWRAPFAAWCGVVPPASLLAWLEALRGTEDEGGKSRHGDAIRRVVVASLEGRLGAAPPPPGWRPPLRDRIRAGLRRAARPFRRTPQPVHG